MLYFSLSATRGKEYGARATAGHYTGRSIKDVGMKGPAASAVEDSMLSKQFAKGLSAKRKVLENDIFSMSTMSEDPIDSSDYQRKIEEAKQLSNATIEVHSDKLVVISTDDDTTVTLETKNPQKLLEQILA